MEKKLLIISFFFAVFSTVSDSCTMFRRAAVTTLPMAMQGLQTTGSSFLPAYWNNGVQSALGSTSNSDNTSGWEQFKLLPKNEQVAIAKDFAKDYFAHEKMMHDVVQRVEAKEIDRFVDQSNSDFAIDQAAKLSEQKELHSKVQEFVDQSNFDSMMNDVVTRSDESVTDKESKAPTSSADIEAIRSQLDQLDSKLQERKKVSVSSVEKELSPAVTSFNMVKQDLEDRLQHSHQMNEALSSDLADERAARVRDQICLHGQNEKITSLEGQLASQKGRFKKVEHYLDELLEGIQEAQGMAQEQGAQLATAQEKLEQFDHESRTEQEVVGLDQKAQEFLELQDELGQNYQDDQKNDSRSDGSNNNDSSSANGGNNDDGGKKESNYNSFGNGTIFSGIAGFFGIGAATDDYAQRAEKQKLEEEVQLLQKSNFVDQHNNQPVADRVETDKVVDQGVEPVKQAAKDTTLELDIEDPVVEESKQLAVDDLYNRAISFKDKSIDRVDTATLAKVDKQDAISVEEKVESVTPVMNKAEVDKTTDTTTSVTALDFDVADALLEESKQLAVDDLYNRSISFDLAERKTETGNVADDLLEESKQLVVDDLYKRGISFEDKSINADISDIQFYESKEELTDDCDDISLPSSQSYSLTSSDQSEQGNSSSANAGIIALCSTAVQYIQQKAQSLTAQQKAALGLGVAATVAAGYMYREPIKKFVGYATSNSRNADQLTATIEKKGNQQEKSVTLQHPISAISDKSERPTIEEIIEKSIINTTSNDLKKVIAEAVKELTKHKYYFDNDEYLDMVTQALQVKFNL